MRNLFAATVLGLALALPAAANAESLADAMRSAYKSSHLLDQNQAVLRAADEDAAIAIAKLRPVLTYTAQASWRQFNNATATATLPTANFQTDSASQSLSASLLIYGGGRARMGGELAQQAVLSARAGLINVEQNVLLSAVSAYVDLQLKSEIVDLRASNTRLIAKQLRAANDRFSVGEITLTDVSVAEARLAAANAGLVAAQGDLNVAREAYKVAVGSYPGALARLPNLPALPQGLDAARAVAQQNHPFIMQAQYQAKIADLQVAMAKAAFGPSLSGSVGYSQDDTGLGNSSVGLQLNQTLYSGGERSALYRKALAQKDAAAANLLQTTLAVEQGVANAWSGLQVAAASIGANAAQVEAAKKAFDGVSEEASLGSRTTLDVLNAEQDLLSARSAQLEAEARRYIGVYQLLSAMGQLTAEKVNLGIPTYDVSAYSDAVKSAPLTSSRGAALDKILSRIAN
jgi:outer membrane protein